MKIQKYLLLRIYLLHTLDQQFTIFVIFFFFQFCSSSLRLSKRGSVNYDWLLGKHPRITSLNIKHYSLRKFYSLPPHFQFTSGQLLSHVNSLWPHGLQHAITNFLSLLKLMSIKPRMPSNHLILYRPLLLLPSILPSIRVFSNESVLHIRWPKYWSFSFSISPSMNIQDWFPLGLTGLISLQSKGLSRVFPSTIQKHQFFSAQLSLWSNSHIHTWLLEKPQLWLDEPLLAK